MTSGSRLRSMAGRGFEIRQGEEAVVVAISDRFLKRIERDAREIGVGISIAADDRRSAALLDPAGVGERSRLQGHDTQDHHGA